MRRILEDLYKTYFRYVLLVIKIPLITTFDVLAKLYKTPGNSLRTVICFSPKFLKGRESSHREQTQRFQQRA